VQRVQARLRGGAKLPVRIFDRSDTTELTTGVVAEVDLAQADAAVDRRDDAAVLDVELLLVDLGPQTKPMSVLFILPEDRVQRVQARLRGGAKLPVRI
jgi:hypothetical protein